MTQQEHEHDAMVDALQCRREEPTEYEAPGEKRYFALFGLGLMHLSGAAHNVGTALIWHANYYTGRCDPAIASLSYETGRHRRTAVKATKELERKRVLRRQRRGRTISNAYHLNWNLLVRTFRHFEQLIRERKAMRDAQIATSLGAQVATSQVPDTPPNPMKRTNEVNQCPERAPSNEGAFLDAYQNGFQDPTYEDASITFNHPAKPRGRDGFQDGAGGDTEKKSNPRAGPLSLDNESRKFWRQRRDTALDALESEKDPQRRQELEAVLVRANDHLRGMAS